MRLANQLAAYRFLAWQKRYVPPKRENLYELHGLAYDP
jgi:hypothetical protein